MALPFLSKPPRHGCGDPGHEIPFACMFDGAQYLTRTPADSGNRKKFTFRTLARRSAFADANGVLFGANTGVGDYFVVAYSISGFLNGEDRLRVMAALGNGSIIHLYTVGLHRDPGGYEDVQVEVDTAQAVETERVRITVNGQRVAIATVGSSPIYPAQNADIPYAAVAGVPQCVGRIPTTSNYFKGYQASPAWLDGITPGPEAFGYTNRFGVWVPRRYTGAYGAQGWHLDFADPLNLGKDVSGNGNHFTAPGLTAANQVTDTPTHGFATLNPLSKGVNVTLSNGNLAYSCGAAQSIVALATTTIPAGVRIYFEAEVPTAATYRNITVGPVLWTGESGLVYINGVQIANGANYGSGDHLAVAADTVEGKVRLYKRTGGIRTLLTTLESLDTASTWQVAFAHGTGSGSYIVNFGQRAYTDPPPHGFAEWSTSALPCPAIKKPDSYFTVRLASNTEGVADLPWNPLVTKTLVLSKTLGLASDWRANDPLRPGRPWASNTTGADFVESGLSFTDTGYTIGSAWAGAGARVDFCFRASRAAGFDMVLVDHVNGIADLAPHGVGGIIDFAIVAPVGVGGNRRVYHRGLAAGQYLTLNGNNAVATDAGWFASSAVDFTLGASLPTGKYAVYAWRSVPGFSWFGTYVGNGSVDGAFLPLDFAPGAALLRNPTLSGTGADWVMVQGEPNPLVYELRPNLPDGETNGGQQYDLLSNGLKLRGTGAKINASGVTHVGAAWSATPIKFARAR